MNYKTQLFVLVVVATAGCSTLYPKAQRPVTGAQATNEPMWIDAHEWETTHQVKEKVGESTHKDNQGNTIGTTDTYENRTVKQRHLEWHAMQGTNRIDDEDFFRIVDDKQALADTKSKRDSAMNVNRIGRISMIVGGLAVISGIVVPNETYKAFAYSGGFLVGGLGWYLAYVGAGNMTEHATPVTRAIGDADEYNRRIGVSREKPGPTAGLSVGRKF